MNLFRTLLLVGACAAPLAATAQWQWIDKDGRKVFSDLAPPADVPANKILRQPGIKGGPVATAEPQAAAPAAPSAGAKPSANAPKLSGKEKELEEKKKQAEAAEAAKKKAEEEKQAAARAESCTRAKQAKSTYDSGVRVTRTNEKGEREVLDDAARAEEVKRMQAIIDADCKL